MTQARKTIVSLADTPYYHCVSRCVRRAYLCGYNSYSSTDYEHRRQWLENKLHHTAAAFAIKLCAYAVMSNHYHVVLNIRSDISNSWSDSEVVHRWHSLFKGTLLSQMFAADESLNKAQRLRLSEDIARWRERLTSPSWFMRIVNESIARRANKEDGRTGRFWEGRFKSQALLDERALLSCMACVDLNPIRATMASSPETSDHTCVKARINALKTNKTLKQTIENFVGSKPSSIGLPFLLKDYLELVDWSGRILRTDKRGAINDGLPPILKRLSLHEDTWLGKRQVNDTLDNVINLIHSDEATMNGFDYYSFNSASLGR